MYRQERWFVSATAGPTLPLVYGIVLLSYAVFLLSLHWLGGHYVAMVAGDFGDNDSYLDIASAIRHWQFTDLYVKHFWGLPYCIAALSLITGLPEPAALAMVCTIASLISIALCYSLWGGWITLYFALLNFDWLSFSLLGGTEPLFVALILGSFLALRHNHWRLAALLAALATVVRPFGLFALIALAVQLLHQKRYRDCLIATAIGLIIGGLYVWPLLHYLGNPLLNVATYQDEDWGNGIPFSFPFVAILQNTFPTESPLTNVIITLAWIVFVLAGVAVAVRNGDFRRLATALPAEACFTGLFCLALFTYNAPDWARTIFPRFAIPVLPWIVFFLRHYLPGQRSVVWSLAVISPAIATVYTVGIPQTTQVLLQIMQK